MGQIDNSPFPEPVTYLFDRRLPEKAIPAGYSALIQAYNLKVPLPHVLFAAGLRHRSLEEDGWRILSTRYTPQPTLEAHLVFALKYEGLHLWVVKRLFQTIGPGAVEDLVLKKPTGAYVRRIWFLYEWLMGSRLDLADASAENRDWRFTFCRAWLQKSRRFCR